MKTMIILNLLSMLSFAPSAFNGQDQPLPESSRLRGTISISGAWALYPMAVKWAEEFGKLYPGVRIDISAGGAGKGMADCLAGMVDLGMVSREIYPDEIRKGAWWVSVTRDAVIPTMNADNPLAGQIRKTGLTRTQLAEIWMEGTLQDWNIIVPGTASHAIHVYTRSDACGAAGTWAQYLNAAQEDLLGVGIYGDPGLAEAVKNDIWGVGFNNINYIYDASTCKPFPGLEPLPIDLNGDRIISADENFYGLRENAVQAIAEGRYPSPPARDLHFVCPGRPEKEAVRIFLSWVLGEGQSYTAVSGYIALSEEQLIHEKSKLNTDNP